MPMAVYVEWHYFLRRLKDKESDDENFQEE
jgi:hypothetical protein